MKDRVKESIEFIRNLFSEANLEGHDRALSADIPPIPDKWSQPELRAAWIDGYLLELRNRMEADK